MAEEKIPLSYKGHPLRRKDNLIYYGSMADKYIIMLQVMETKKVDDLDVATKVSVQLQLTDDVSQRSSCQIFNRGNRTLHAVGKQLRVGNLEEDYRINSHGNIILSDNRLWREINHLLF